MSAPTSIQLTGSSSQVRPVQHEQPEALSAGDCARQHDKETTLFLAFAKACGLPSLDPHSLDVLRSYEVNLSSIAARTAGEIRQEFEMLLDHHLVLLQDSKKLDEFLQSRLTENSWREAERFCGASLPSQSVFWTVLGGVRTLAGKILHLSADPTEERLSPRARATDKVVAEMEKTEKSPQLGDNLHVGRSDSSITHPAFLPVDILALPPCEVFHPVMEKEHAHSLFVSEIRFLPSGVGSMKDVHTLFLTETGCKSLPESLSQLEHLEKMLICACPNLHHLPESLKKKNALKEFIVSKETENQALLEEICQLSLQRLGILSLDSILEKLPTNLRTMSSLESLVLSSCSWEVFNEINQLPIKELTIIDTLSKNGTLPESLLKMDTLRKITVYVIDSQKAGLLQQDPVIQSLRAHKVEVKIEVMAGDISWEAI